ncbi:MAG: PorP/SprF family type IX secretion system membrane protein [Bacteroidota bacterium]
MKKILKLSWILIGISLNIYAQDIHFSQYTEAPLYLNPALATVSYDTRAIGYYRSQWSSIGKSYLTYGVTLEQAINHLKLKANHFGIALNIFYDNAGNGLIKNLMPYLGVNYVMKIATNSKLSVGLQAGTSVRTINSSNFTWDSQFDGFRYNPNLPGENTTLTGIARFDMGGGFNYHFAKSERYISAEDGAKFDVGFAAYHLTTPKFSFFNTGDRLYMKYIGYFNGDFGIKSAGIALVPSITYIKQGPSKEITTGFLVKYIIKDQSVYTGARKAMSLSLGAYYRLKDAVIPTLLFQFDKWGLGIAYDINLSDLTPATKTKGGMEVCLRFNTSPGYGKALGGSFNKSYMR